MSEMPIHIYRLRTDPTLRPYAKMDNPVRSDGTGLFPYLIDSEPCVLNLKRCNKKLPDLFTAFVNELFSDKAKEVISSLKLDVHLHWIDIDVQLKGQHLQHFQAITIRKGYHVLNLEKSQHDRMSLWKVVGSVSNWVINPEKVPELDLFMCHNSEWMVTQNFKETWENAGLTGAVFHECEISK
ncbi:hypothetical protein [uncultured Rubinisphaera sp.]|uniref:imm11 family protein n=1 Tax=uncultured Rubinisphaera sp. TaxID=1678686 RepID=UPI0030DB290B